MHTGEMRLLPRTAPAATHRATSTVVTVDGVEPLPMVRALHTRVRFWKPPQPGAGHSLQAPAPYEYCTHGWWVGHRGWVNTWGNGGRVSHQTGKPEATPVPQRNPHPPSHTGHAGGGGQQLPSDTGTGPKRHQTGKPGATPVPQREPHPPSHTRHAGEVSASSRQTQALDQSATKQENPRQRRCPNVTHIPPHTQGMRGKCQPAPVRHRHWTKAPPSRKTRGNASAPT